MRVLLVEGVHRPPCERDEVAQCRALRGRVDVLPRAAASDVALAANDVEPFRFAEV